MTSLTDVQSDLLSELAKKTEKSRKLDRQMRKLKKECDAMVTELETTAKNNNNNLTNGTHAVTFKMRKGGGYEVPKWRKFGVDQIITLN